MARPASPATIGIASVITISAALLGLLLLAPLLELMTAIRCQTVSNCTRAEEQSYHSPPAAAPSSVLSPPCPISCPANATHPGQLPPPHRPRSRATHLQQHHLTTSPLHSSRPCAHAPCHPTANSSSTTACHHTHPRMDPGIPRPGYAGGAHVSSCHRSHLDTVRPADCAVVDGSHRRGEVGRCYIPVHNSH